MSYYIVACTLIPSYFFSKGATQSYQGNWIGFDLIAKLTTYKVISHQSCKIGCVYKIKFCKSGQHFICKLIFCL